MIRGLTLCLFALALLAVASVLALALFGSEDLLLAALKDDGFYFLVLAKNVAQGHGATFDGLGPTNGFHPLWLLLLTPIFWIDWPSLFVPVRLMLLLALGLHLAAAGVIYRFCLGLVDRPAARLAALAYVANPLVLYLVVSGMESPVVALVTALLSLEVARLLRGDARATVGEAIRFGLYAGLCMLARTDLALLAGCAFAAVLLLPGGAQQAARERIITRGTSLARAAAVAAVVVSPWIVWNLVRFGSVVQVSARAHHLHSVSLRAPGEPEGVARLLTTGSSLLSTVYRVLSSRAGLPAPLVAAGSIGVLLLLAWWLWSVLSSREMRAESAERLRLLATPLVYAAGFLAAAFFFLGHIRSWYLAGPLTVAGMLLAWPIDLSLRRRAVPRGGRAASGLLFGGVVVAAGILGVVLTREILENGRAGSVWKDATAWVSAHTSEGDRVASFNSGTFGYLAPRVVVNLDCVVNNRALPWLERARLVEFLRRERIRYLIDDRSYVARYLRDYGEPDWRKCVVPVDTLPRGLVAYEIR